MDRLFDNKRRKNNIDDEEMIELGIPCVDVKELQANGVLRVSQDQKGRIDRFALANVDIDRNSIDILMYFNHIYNPFSIDEGDILFTPVYNDSVFKKKGEPVMPDGTKHSNNTSGKKELTYAEKVEKAARTGLGVR